MGRYHMFAEYCRQKRHVLATAETLAQVSLGHSWHPQPRGEQDACARHSKASTDSSSTSRMLPALPSSVASCWSQNAMWQLWHANLSTPDANAALSPGLMDHHMLNVMVEMTFWQTALSPFSILYIRKPSRLGFFLVFLMITDILLLLLSVGFQMKQQYVPISILYEAVSDQGPV